MFLNKTIEENQALKKQNLVLQEFIKIVSDRLEIEEGEFFTWKCFNNFDENSKNLLEACIEFQKNSV